MDKHQPETAGPTNITTWQKSNVGTLPKEIKATWQHLKPILPQQQVLDTPIHQKSKIWIEKSQLMMLIESFKKDINNSLKEIQNTSNQAEVLREL